MLNSEATSGGAPVPGAFGRFSLRELINSGGMADIWVAMDSNGKHHALRLMHKRYRYDYFAKRRFIRGCEILAKLADHEQIIGYHEHGKVQGQPYLLMEYVEASNLKELQTRSDPILAENVAQILIDMATALEYMHENGFMHLDFKPENVLITRNGRVRLIDFDLSRPIPAKPKKLKKNPGTPAYMAPEQLLQQPISHPVDMFSFGVCAYEILTNQKPFPGDSPGEILAKQIDRSSFLPPRAHNPDLPPNLEAVILRCLQQEPTNRYPVMSAMARDLRTALYV